MTGRIVLFFSFFLSFALAGCRTTGTEEAQNSFDQATFASADTDGNGRLTEHELALHKHREALAEFDLDNDSHISAAEWTAARPSSGEQDEHFNQLDKDSDGKISEQEGVRFITENASFDDMFKKYDTNGDFHLHWEEIDEGSPKGMNITLFSLPPDA